MGDHDTFTTLISLKLSKIGKNDISNKS